MDPAKLWSLRSAITDLRSELRAGFSELSAWRLRWLRLAELVEFAATASAAQDV